MFPDYSSTDDLEIPGERDDRKYDEQLQNIATTLAEKSGKTKFAVILRDSP